MSETNPSRPPMRLFCYLILFHHEHGVSHIESFADLGEHYTVHHLLERSFSRTLPILWHCLHLPRKTTDFVWIPWAFLAEEQWRSAATPIMLAPIAALSHPSWKETLRARPPDVVFYPEDFAVSEIRELFPAALPQRHSEIGPQALATQWAYLDLLADALGMQLGQKLNGSPPPEFFEQSSVGVRLLPTIHFGRQISGGWEQSTRELGIAASFHHHDRALTVARVLEAGGGPESISPELATKFIHNEDSGIHIALSFPGHRDAKFAWSEHGWLCAENDEQVESLAFDCLVTHRANSTSGAAMRAFVIPDDCYKLLAQIEQYYRHPKRRPHKLRGMLRNLALRLRDLLMATLTDRVAEQMAVLRRARSITAFTMFPVGLMQFSSGDTPLGMAVPIAYRPIFPLGQILQGECLSTTMRLTGLRVLVLQCISPDEEMVSAEAENWANIDADIRLNQLGSLRVVMISNKADIDVEISDFKPNILVISGHGIEVQHPRITAISVGDDFFFGHELAYVPPIVILSSCSVAARGRDSLSVAELLLRNGAFSVLGAQIDIDYRRNARLLATFFDRLIEAMNATEVRRSLLDVWHQTFVENAIVDILFTSTKIREWADKAEIDGVSVLRYLLDVRGKEIRTGLIYEDALRLLQECADRTAFGDTFRSTVQSQGYFAESTFYQLIGWPERFRLHAR